jgi:hypothetical protein
VGLGNNYGKFRLFHHHGAGVGHGLLGEILRSVTYGVCVVMGWGRMDGGFKKYKGLERQKEHAILTGSPQGGVFSSRQRIVLALSFRHGVTKGDLGSVRYPQSPGLLTRIRLFPILVDFETRNNGHIRLSQAWAGQV